MKSERNITSAIRTDRFEAIEYIKHPGRKSTAIGLQLGAHFVFKWIFQDAWNHISGNIATADRFKFYTTESLFNDADAWAGFGTPIRIAIGRCLRYFVDNEMLPLFCVNPHATSAKLYMVVSQ